MDGIMLTPIETVYQMNVLIIVVNLEKYMCNY
jgi:hypothetical protein